MSKKTIQAPTQGRGVLFDATHLVIGAKRLIVPAVVHQVEERDLVSIWAVDSDGEVLHALGGTLPTAVFGEVRPGVPAAEAWCYPPRSDETVEVEVSDEEPTFTP